MTIVSPAVPGTYVAKKIASPTPRSVTSRNTTTDSLRLEVTPLSNGYSRVLDRTSLTSLMRPATLLVQHDLEMGRTPNDQLTQQSRGSRSRPIKRTRTLPEEQR